MAPKEPTLVFGGRLAEMREKERKRERAKTVAVAPEVWPAPPRRSAESQRIGARIESNKSLSGHLRSRPSGASLIFPAFCRETPPPPRSLSFALSSALFCWAFVLFATATYACLAVSYQARSNVNAWRKIINYAPATTRSIARCKHAD